MGVRAMGENILLSKLGPDDIAGEDESFRKIASEGYTKIWAAYAEFPKPSKFPSRRDAYQRGSHS